MEQRFLEEIKNRLREQGVNCDDFYVMWQRKGTYLESEEISGFTESKDGKFICVPVYDEEANVIIGEFNYRPQCFEVAEKYETYLSDGYMSILTNVWLFCRR